MGIRMVPAAGRHPGSPPVLLLLSARPSSPSRPSSLPRSPPAKTSPKGFPPFFPSILVTIGRFCSIWIHHRPERQGWLTEIKAFSSVSGHHRQILLDLDTPSARKTGMVDQDQSIFRRSGSTIGSFCSIWIHHRLKRQGWLTGTVHFGPGFPARPSSPSRPSSLPRSPPAKTLSK